MKQPQSFPFKEEAEGNISNSKFKSYYQQHTRQTDIIKGTAIEVTYMEKLVFSEKNWDNHARNIGNIVLLGNRGKKVILCIYFYVQGFLHYLSFEIDKTFN